MIPDVHSAEMKWQASRPWESIFVPIEGFEGMPGIDLLETRQGPHMLLSSDDADARAEFMREYMHSAAVQFSPAEVNFFVMDLCGGGLFADVEKLPHFAGGVKDGGWLNLGLQLIEEEQYLRNGRLRTCEVRNAREYVRLCREEQGLDGMPLMIIAVNGVENMSDDARERLGELIWHSRNMGMYWIVGARDDALNDQLYSVCRIKLNPDGYACTLDEEFEAAGLASAAAQQGIAARKLTDNCVWNWNVESDDGETKALQLVRGDLCMLQDKCDVVVCSAFRNNYVPTFRSLIGALYRERHIDVNALSDNPELDFKSLGCWLSGDTGEDYRRVACVELLDYADRKNKTQEELDQILRRSFATLRFILEQADIAGIPVETVALPILGSGSQHIDFMYILGPLVAQCSHILRSNPGVKKMVIYEREKERAQQVAKTLDAAFATRSGLHRVFVSYSSRQETEAQRIAGILRRQGISCWMAPGSIPAGSSYQEAIPVAISQTDVVLLLLTQDAEKSRWVQKEVGSAIGADKILLPYQMNRYNLGKQMMFLLDGEQIMYADEDDGDCSRLIERLRDLLQMG